MAQACVKNERFKGANIMRDKCAVHKTNTAWGNLNKKQWLNAIAQELKQQHRPQSERGNTCEAGPFRNESLNEAQASDREGQAA